MQDLTHSISKNALDFSGKFLTNQDRVLIIGSTGWVGRTSTAIASSLGIPTLLLASKSREFQIGKTLFYAKAWNEAEVADFDPTVIIDAAYVTREFASKFSLDDYVEINRQLTQRFIGATRGPSVRKALTFSSGAAVKYVTDIGKKSIEADPYGFLKAESEAVLMDEFKDSDLDFSFTRIWSISGTLATKINEFAFSDFIDQSRTNRIIIASESKVYRRYCLAEEVIAIGLHHDSRKDGILDTGGTLIEIRELAKLVARYLNPSAKIFDSKIKCAKENHYYSDSNHWDEVLSRYQFNPATIEDQIRHVGKWLNQ
jgi:nucleoside-diphosphate-sugar epimerase